MPTVPPEVRSGPSAPTLRPRHLPQRILASPAGAEGSIMTNPSLPYRGSDEAGENSASSGLRWYCPLQSCLPVPLEGYPVGGINDTIIRGSASFATEDAYLRHIRVGHFIARVNAPKAFILGVEQKGAA